MSTPGRLYGVGLGPGDPELVTVKAARLISAAPVVAYHCARHGNSIARSVADPYLRDGQIEERLMYPLTVETTDHPGGYAGAMADFYTESAELLAGHLAAGRDVVLLAEGDPLFFSSYMHMHKRLADRFDAEIVPGVTSVSGASAALGIPLVEGEETLTVLPGTAEHDELVTHIRSGEALAVMKLGRTFGKVRDALAQAGRLDEAWYVERASTARQRVERVIDVDPESVPYFSLVVVPGRRNNPLAGSVLSTRSSANASDRLKELGQPPTPPDQPLDQPAPPDEPLDQPAPPDELRGQPVEPGEPLQQPAPPKQLRQQPSPPDQLREQPAPPDQPRQQPAPLQRPAPPDELPGQPVEPDEPLGEVRVETTLTTGEPSRTTGQVTVVGLGPGPSDQTTPQVTAALAEATDLVGYTTYLKRLTPHPGQRVHATDNRVEVERAAFALDLAARGARVAVVSSGDPGVFAMATAVAEVAAEPAWRHVPVRVLPGVSAAQAVAAAVGAPLGHDFAVFSLSDLLKPWSVIEQRIRAAIAADLVFAVYNPASSKRTEQILAFQALLDALVPPGRVLIQGRDVGGPGERLRLLTVAEFDPSTVDMRTLLIVGSSQTRIVRRPGGDLAYTPRSYPDHA
ncbi:precorrin-2 C(20)-methyltransferase [Gordonia sp. PP30]|uniref:precorrin-2 C(20)-methyltransferase n=1 Tax=Gordonia sp. PP30 TaxID=2935861 RepID=UPI001FFF4FF2|nr:precorrin-2 C(20)-methyltransferase [Gordonia sp. PP30]UQE76763.1 precorrin-2 C(20)-methyltransferase [Gordonia sp. PP30]